MINIKLKFKLLTTLFLVLIPITFSQLVRAERALESDLLGSTLKDDLQGAGKKAFRLTLMKSNSKEDDYSFTVQFGSESKEATLVTRAYNKKSKSVTRSRYALSVGQVNNLLRFERASNFWNLPSSVKSKKLDGTRWVLEGVDGQKYHRTLRVSPLPPYYSKILDVVTGELIKDPNTLPEREVKSSDEVGLDMLCMLIIFLRPGYDESLY